VITDHHLPGAALPAADAIVNPNQPGCSFPSKNLAGVGVMFYVLMALRARLRAMGWFQARDLPETNLAELLDLVALGTVADVVPLDGNNRILVAQGLARMRAGYCRAGIRALIEVSGRNLSRLTASDLGFAIGPRLNAAGRLSDMSLGIECLLSEADSAALEMAKCLDELNRDRRAIEWQMQTQALAILETLTLEHSQDLPFGVCLFDEGWHQGVIGIVASRLVERYHRPVVLIAGAEELWKGSGRSTGAFDLHAGLAACSAELERFGGHRAAAGFSIRPERVGAFAAAFAAHADAALTEEELRPVTFVDALVHGSELTLQLCAELARLGPFGLGNPGVTLLVGGCELVELATVGEGRHLRFRVRDGGSDAGSAIAFGFGRQLDRYRRVGHYDIAFRLEENHWNGTVAPQLVVRRIFEGADRFEELYAWLRREWTAKRRAPEAEAVFRELELEAGGPRRHPLESETFRALLAEPALLRAA
jgi:single-stranded-DNA-specific exonuclease